MPEHPAEIPIERARVRDGPEGTDPVLQDASFGELFKRLSTDSTHLVQQEIQLAKTELQESAARAAAASGKLGIAAGLAVPGVLAVITALVIVLGILMHSYWGSALIIGLLTLVAAVTLGKRAVAEIKSSLVPKKTVLTARDYVEWAKRETERAKQEISA